ncbi:sugar transferase [Abyssibacter profundi]|uniref:Bacterial sugar transferase domain-containing protein n=1 Tax=Abyssibacter profundi TaxID=2182787 RepID=A0A383XPM7_9GAMM|nr:sugar transferase [Abyssibacter profundi]PWN54581.1 hypothetical protein DEH80_16605 [Abyssibacter profundi]
MKLNKRGGAYLSSKRKRALDLMGGALGVGVFFPVFCGLYAFRRLQNEPVFFMQERIGLGGKAFICPKFRSMTVGADGILQDYLKENEEARAEWNETQKLKDDPRIDSFGLFIRKTSLDELPQFFVVISGAMSLVGPRPVTDCELIKYKRSVRAYRSCRPGLTGIWQVSGRNDVSYQRRVAMDRYYSMNASAGLDLYILLKTVFIILTRKGAY